MPPSRSSLEELVLLLGGLSLPGGETREGSLVHAELLGELGVAEVHLLARWVHARRDACTHRPVPEKGKGGRQRARSRAGVFPCAHEATPNGRRRVFGSQSTGGNNKT